MQALHGQDNQTALIRALNKKAVSRPPFWYMRQAGRYLPEYQAIRRQYKNFLEMCYTPEAATEVTLQPIRRFDADAAILFSDILVVPDALGADVRFIEKRGPVLTPVRTREALAALSMKRQTEFLSPVYEAVSRIRKSLPKEKALIGFAGAPWTIACYLVEGEGSRDFAETRKYAYADPAWFDALITLLTRATAEHLIQQIRHGADAVQLFDSWAGLLPEEEFLRWVVQPTKEIVKSVKQEFPEIPIIGFPKGAGILYEAYAKESGVDAVGIDAQMPLQWVRDHLQPYVTVQGNLDPLLLASDKEKAIARAREIFSCWKGKPFIFNLGHGIIPSTPPEHVEALSEAVKALQF